MSMKDDLSEKSLFRFIGLMRCLSLPPLLRALLIPKPMRSSFMQVAKRLLW